MNRILSILLSLFLSATVLPLNAIDLQIVRESSNFWKWTENNFYTQEKAVQRAILMNLSIDKPYIMKAEHDEQGNLTSFHVHNGRTYSEEDFAFYKQKHPDYAHEQLKTAEFLISLTAKYPTALFDPVKQYIHTLEEAAKGEDWASELSLMFDQIQVKIVLNKFDIPDLLLKKYPHFATFLIRNGLLDSIIEMGHSIAYDKDTLMPYLRVDDQLVAWSSLESDYLNFPHDSYIYTKAGLITLPDGIKPSSTRSKNHGKGPAIQLVTRFDYIDFNTDPVGEEKLLPMSYHSWVRLINEDGVTFSFGLWGAYRHRSTLLNAVAYLVPHTGKVHNPDPFEQETTQDAANKRKNIVTTTIALNASQYEMLFDYLSELARTDEVLYETNGLIGHDSGSFVINLLHKLSVATDNKGTPLAQNQHKMDVFSQLSYYGYFAGAKTLWKWQTAEKKRRDAIVENLISHGATQKSIDAVKFAAPLEFAQ